MSTGDEKPKKRPRPRTPKEAQEAAEALLAHVKVTAAKNPGGRPPFEATEEQRKQVMTLVSFGIPEEHICHLVWPKKPISLDTLQRHFRHELDHGLAAANAQVAGFLFQNAKNGNLGAQIFWLKSRAKWREADNLPVVPGTNGLTQQDFEAKAAEVDAVKDAVKDILNDY